MEFQHFIYNLEKMIKFKNFNTPQGLSTVDVFLEHKNEIQLNKRLPHSSVEYVKGKLLYPNGDIFPIKMKYRGDHVQHWGHYKKSTRIKTKKKHLYKGLRKFNINAPKYSALLNSHLSYELAHRLDLLAPRSEMVFYRINGQYRGIHLYVEQLEELTLRHNQKMPGDMYVGEAVGRDYYHGLSHEVFDYPGIWKKVSFNNHYSPASSAPIKKLLEELRKYNAGEQNVFFDLIDIDAWAKFTAFEALAQTFHFDLGHNWRLYYDPITMKFQPIVWDPIGWMPKIYNMPKTVDLIHTKMHKALFQIIGFYMPGSRYCKVFMPNKWIRIFFIMLKTKLMF